MEPITIPNLDHVLQHQPCILSSEPIEKTIGYATNGLVVIAPVGIYIKACRPAFHSGFSVDKTADAFSPHQPAGHLAALRKLASKERAS